MKILLTLFVSCLICFAQNFNVSNSQELRDALSQSANNHQDDVITLQKGTYLTSKKGAFLFQDNQQYNLTIQSAKHLSAKDVVLDGEKVSQIINYQNSKNSTLYLKGVTLQNGNFSYYAGMLFSNQGIDLEDCHIKSDIISSKTLYALKGMNMVNISLQ